MKRSSVRRRTLIGLAVGLAIVTVPVASAIQDDDSPSLGLLPLYEALIEGELEPAGRIREVLSS